MEEGRFLNSRIEVCKASAVTTIACVDGAFGSV